MKQLTCEMCGSTNLLKQDGIFVCQTCGCKYSVEEVKKMMIEGTVDITGSTIKLDTADELNNLYKIARRAKEENNADNAAKYYDMILVKDPTSWEASFYVIYFKAIRCKIAEIGMAASSVANCQNNVFLMIRDNVPEDEQSAAVEEVFIHSSYIANLLADSERKYYDGIDSSIQANYTNDFFNNAHAIINIMDTCGSAIESIYENKDDTVFISQYAYKEVVSLYSRLFDFPDSSRKYVESTDNLVSIYVNKIEKYDKAYAEKYYAKKKAEKEQYEKEQERERKRRLTFEFKQKKSEAEREYGLLYSKMKKAEWSSQDTVWGNIGPIIVLMIVLLVSFIVGCILNIHSYFEFKEFSNDFYDGWAITFFIAATITVVLLIKTIRSERRKIIESGEDALSMKSELKNKQNEFCALEENYLKNCPLNDDDLEYFCTLKVFDEDFLKYLKKLKSSNENSSTEDGKYDLLSATVQHLGLWNEVYYNE